MLANQIQRLLADAALRQDLIDKGYRQAALYTWARAGEAIRNILVASTGL